MKRFLIVVSLFALSASAALAQATPKAHPATSKAHPATHRAHRPASKPIIPRVMYLHYAVAPADEYFGRLKMSILGIRNTIRDAGLKADADPAHAANAVMGSVGLTEDAMRDWELKYPRDSWIPPALFSLERLYAKVDSDAARERAKYVMLWLVHDYPASAQAKIGKKELSANLVGVKPEPALGASNATVAGGAGDTALH